MDEGTSKQAVSRPPVQLMFQLSSLRKKISWYYYFKSQPTNFKILLSSVILKIRYLITDIKMKMKGWGDGSVQCLQDLTLIVPEPMQKLSKVTHTYNPRTRRQRQEDHWSLLASPSVKHLSQTIRWNNWGRSPTPTSSFYTCRKEEGN